MRQKTAPNRRERKKEKTRQDIAAAGINLFRTKGYHATTMDEVADMVDVSKTTIYNYFPTKEAIVSEWIQDGYRRIREIEVPRVVRDFPDTASRLQELFRLSHEWVRENGELYQVYFSYRMQNIVNSFRDQSRRTGFETSLAMILAAGQDVGEIRADFSAEVLARHVEMMSGAAFMRWWVDPESFSVEKDVSPTIEIFLNGAHKRATT